MSAAHNLTEISSDFQADALLDEIEELRRNVKFHFQVIRGLDLDGVTALGKLGFFNRDMRVTTLDIRLRVMEAVAETLLTRDQKPEELAELIKPASTDAGVVTKLAGEMVVASRMQALIATATEMKMPAMAMIFAARRATANQNVNLFVEA